MKYRIYIDTSIVGGYFDKEFESKTKALFNRLAREEMIFVISDLLDIELLEAPKKVRNLLNQYPNDYFERIEMDQEVITLANRYIEENVVGETSLEDCRHIALATINKVDALASWNFKHIVNLDRIKGYNSVNIKWGYPELEIRSPIDLINYENKK
ncbi:MAG: hypothetical protein K9J27_10950 [Bacteroidales bacterium]|nr:hypothetical protein [Bacteroidales bacterium]MCF8334599.1 hypothetical protein [Bacteroidales bacterium]